MYNLTIVIDPHYAQIEKIPSGVLKRLLVINVFYFTEGRTYISQQKTIHKYGNLFVNICNAEKPIIAS